MMSVLIPLAGFSQRADLPRYCAGSQRTDDADREHGNFIRYGKYGNDIAEPSAPG